MTATREQIDREIAKRQNAENLRVDIKNQLRRLGIMAHVDRSLEDINIKMDAEDALLMLTQLYK